MLKQFGREEKEKPGNTSSCEQKKETGEWIICSCSEHCRQSIERDSEEPVIPV